jgi:hypothetical protein
MKAEEMSDIKKLDDFYTYVIRRVNPN